MSEEESVEDYLDTLRHNLLHIAEPMKGHGKAEMMDYAKWSLVTLKQLHNKLITRKTPRPMPPEPMNQCDCWRPVDGHKHWRST